MGVSVSVRSQSKRSSPLRLHYRCLLPRLIGVIVRWWGRQPPAPAPAPVPASPWAGLRGPEGSPARPDGLHGYSTAHPHGTVRVAASLPLYFAAISIAGSRAEPTLGPSHLHPFIPAPGSSPLRTLSLAQRLIDILSLTAGSIRSLVTVVSFGFIPPACFYCSARPCPLLMILLDLGFYRAHVAFRYLCKI